MHSFLLVGNNVETLTNKVKEMSSTGRGYLVEQHCSTIEEVRELKHFVGLASRDKLFIYLPQIHQASVAAQNALLKTLEEPQKNITFLITTENEEKVLPTIRSRCEIIRIITSVNQEALQTFKDYAEMGVGQKIKRISTITKKEEAIIFLKSLIEGGSVAILDDNGVYPIVESAQVALERIEANGNVQIQLTNFVVQHLSQEQG